MLVNLAKVFDKKAMTEKLRTRPNPDIQLLDALFGGAGGKVHRNIKVGVAADSFDTENVPFSTRSGSAYTISDSDLDVKEAIPQPVKLERAMTAAELNDMDSVYSSLGMGGVREWAADLAERYRNIFIKSAQAQAAHFLSSQGDIVYYNHSIGGGVTAKTWSYPNKPDWNTFTPAAVWSGLTIIGIYDDLRAMAKQMRVATGIGGPYTCIVAANVFSQILGKVQAWTSTASFSIAVRDLPNGNSYIQLGAFRIEEVSGTYRNWSTTAGTAEALITTKKIYMFSDSQRRQLLWCRMDIIRGNKSFVDGQMDITPYFDEKGRKWILQGEAKPFCKINPAGIIEATVLT
jgi:hypothetical protein